jgi:uncharacterized membrane protein
MKLNEVFKWKHIGESPLTSIVGIVVLGVSVFSIYKNKTVTAEDITLLGIAIGLFTAKDPTQVPPGGGAVSCVVFFMLLAGCATNKRCLEKYPSTPQTITLHDTITVRVEVPIAADSLDGQITKDSLQMLVDGVIDSLSSISESKDLAIKFWKDKSTGALKYKAKKKASTVVVEKEEPVTLTGNCPPVVVAVPPTLRWYEKLWEKFQFFSAVIVLGGICLVIALLILKRI